MKHKTILIMIFLFIFLSGSILAQKNITPSRLVGKWLKPIGLSPPSGKAIKEGMILTSDGRLDFVNINSTKGDRWELENDTLILWSHTERFPEPQPDKFVILKLTTTKLEIKPKNGVPGYKITYKQYK